jgi:D-3-phosphoglycerate dehydrogenase
VELDVKALVRAPFDHAALQRLGQSVEVTYDNWMEEVKLLSSEEFIDCIQRQDMGIVIVEADFLFRDVFEAAPKLQLLGICRADTNHVDLAAASEFGISVINTPARNDLAVAELAMGLMLSLVRGIPKSHRMVSSGEWVDPTAQYFGLRGTELTGKTVGIVGFGAIGRRLARMLCGFDGTVLAYDPYVSKDMFTGSGVTPVELDELMSRADFVCLHCATVPETAGLIDARRIGLMKPSAYLVNAASTYVIDMEAIVQALRDKRIAGAGFDVYETWPVAADSPLLELENVVLTPHTGGATWETIARYSNMIVDDVERFLKGERPKYLLNPGGWEKRER